MNIHLITGIHLNGGVLIYPFPRTMMDRILFLKLGIDAYSDIRHSLHGYAHRSLDCCSSIPSPQTAFSRGDLSRCYSVLLCESILSMLPCEGSRSL